VDWRRIPDGKEKYQAYLCSREWSEKKEAVRKRSSGICERCRVNMMDAVHHLTYERKYAERLSDLQAICKACHEFTHAKSQYDPRVFAPVFVEGSGPECSGPIRILYLAGKITQDRWRDEIVKDWSFENHSEFTWDACSQFCGEEWQTVKCAAAASNGSRLDYCGPWWSDLEYACGHGDVSQCSEPHAYGQFQDHGFVSAFLCGEAERPMNIVSRNVEIAINECDLLFAWINSDDCFGTIFEIGMAVALGKTVVVASPPEFDHHQMWLCRKFATKCVSGETAGEAWNSLWNQSKEAIV
jgi:hypothetical protein